jgi:hypothetical protein
MAFFIALLLVQFKNSIDLVTVKMCSVYCVNPTICQGNYNMQTEKTNNENYVVLLINFQQLNQNF